MDEETKSRSATLAYLQAMDLEDKVSMTKWRIREFLAKEDAYVSFSGGKDSTVLAHLVHQIDPSVPLVFSNTGLEYQAIQSFARKMGAQFVRPEMNFAQVITKYGYPMISKEVAEAIYYARRIRSNSVQVERERERERTRDRKRAELHPENGKTGAGGVFSPDKEFGDRSLFNKQKWLPAATELPYKISHYCCNKMKKQPLQKYARNTGRHPIIGTLAVESRVRKQAWIRHGCNVFDGSHISSQPLSFWTEQDILHYIKKNDLEIAEPYGEICYYDPFGCEIYESLDFGDELHCTGCQRTGCVFCCFGAHSRKDNRFLELKRIAPRQYEYAMGGGKWIENPDYVSEAPEYDGKWKNWNPEKIWVPSKEGLGFAFVIDEFNKLYPENKIRY